MPTRACKWLRKKKYAGVAVLDHTGPYVGNDLQDSDTPLKGLAAHMLPPAPMTQ